jgi:hypothetical protein
VAGGAGTGTDGWSWPSAGTPATSGRRTGSGLAEKGVVARMAPGSSPVMPAGPASAVTTMLTVAMVLMAAATRTVVAPRLRRRATRAITEGSKLDGASASAAGARRA